MSSGAFTGSGSASGAGTLVRLNDDNYYYNYGYKSGAERDDVKSGRSFENPVVWGEGLQTEHERFLAEEHVKGPVTIFNYPKDIKPFYMRRNDDGKTVAAMDLLVPGIGEIVGGSQREERLEVLEANGVHAITDEYDDYVPTPALVAPITVLTSLMDMSIGLLIAFRRTSALGLVAGGGALRGQRDAWDDVFGTAKPRKIAGLRWGGVALIGVGIVTNDGRAADDGYDLEGKGRQAFADNDPKAPGVPVKGAQRFELFFVVIKRDDLPPHRFV